MLEMKERTLDEGSRQHASHIASMIIERPQDALRIVEDENPGADELLWRCRARDTQVSDAFHIYHTEFINRIKRWLNGSEMRAKRAKIASKRISLLAQLGERDGGLHCQHCGATDDLCIDHITPLVRGGSNELDNLQILCKSCNSRKGDRWGEYGIR